MNPKDDMKGQKIIHLNLEIVYSLDNEFYSIGNRFRAYFMRLIKEHHPELLSLLHDKSNVIRPYSIQFTRNHSELLNIHLNLFPIKTREDINCDWTDVIQTLITRSADYQKYSLYFVKMIFNKVRLDDLMRNIPLAAGMHLYFPRPTAFQSKSEYTIRFPDPVHLMNNIINISRAFFPSSFQEDKKDFLKWVKRHVFISSHELKTVHFPVKAELRVLGFKGNVRLKVLKPQSIYHVNEKKREPQIQLYHDKNIILLNTLLKIASFSNVGVNRTLGMGTLVYTPDNPDSKKS